MKRIRALDCCAAAKLGLAEKVLSSRHGIFFLILIAPITLNVQIRSAGLAGRMVAPSNTCLNPKLVRTQTTKTTFSPGRNSLCVNASKDAREWPTVVWWATRGRSLPSAATYAGEQSADSDQFALACAAKLS